MKGLIILSCVVLALVVVCIEDANATKSGHRHTKAEIKEQRKRRAEKVAKKNKEREEKIKNKQNKSPISQSLPAYWSPTTPDDCPKSDLSSTCGNVLNVVLTQNQKSNIQDAHNAIRIKVPKNCKILWNEDLAAESQLNVEKCDGKPDDCDYSSAPNVGLISYTDSRMTDTANTGYFTSIIKGWTVQNSEEYAIMISDDITAFGCAALVYSKNVTLFQFTCSYRNEVGM